MLGRRLRLLRAAPEPRRLRRDRDDRAPALGARPQGRDDGHLLRRDQPAVRRAARSARPGGDLAALDDRRDRDDPVPRRHPQYRIRGRLGAAAPAGGRAGRAERRPALRLSADPERRSDLPGQPGAPWRGGQPDGQDPRQLSLQRAGCRSAGPDHVRPQDQGADVHGLPVGGRADGRALPRPGRALHRHQAQVVHVHQRRARRLAGSVHVRPVVRLLRAVRRPSGAGDEPGGGSRGRAGDLSAGDGAAPNRRRHAAARPDPARADLPVRPVRVRGAAVGARAVRQRRRAVADGQFDAGRPISRL